MNNNSMQMLMDALARAQQGMPSMRPSPYDMSNAYQQGSTSDRDTSNDAAPQGAIAKMGMLLAPNSTQAIMQGGGTPSASTPDGGMSKMPKTLPDIDPAPKQSGGFMQSLGNAFIPNTMKSVAAGKGGAG